MKTTFDQDEFWRRRNPDPDPSGPGGNEPDPPAPDPGDPGDGGGTTGPSGAPLLIPGAGFSGPTPAPGAVGDESMPGYTATAIARWDVVPFQTVTGPFTVGVMAFHINGIEKVDFSLNGGPWVASTEMTLNERTNAVEYWAVLDPATTPDGTHEVRARVWPKDAGIPRVLAGELTAASAKTGNHSLVISTNATGLLPSEARYVSPSGDDDAGDGTRQNPYASMMKATRSIADAQGGDAGGGTLYLLPGEHAYGGYTYALRASNENRWLTIEPAPGVDPSQVSITSVSNLGLRLKLVHLKNLTMRGVSIRDKDPNSALWVENGDLAGSGTTDSTRLIREAEYPLGAYLTGTRLSAVVDASKEIGFFRNCVIEGAGTDALRNPLLVINSEVRDLGNGEEYGHRDLIQFYRGGENIIINGLRAVDEVRGQGIFAAGIEDDRLDNIAIVNSALASRTHSMQWGLSCNHMIIQQNTFDRPFLFRDDSRRPAGFDRTYITNLSITDNVFRSLAYGIADLGARIDNNFFMEGNPIGTNATTGDPMFMDAEGGDYTPATGSPLRNRVMHPLMPLDVNGDRRRTPASLGAEEPRS